MAKKCMINRNEKRQKMVENQKEIRKELRKKAMDETLNFDERLAAQFKLQALPANGAANRVNNICSLTGRSRGNYRKFGICRIKFRDLALEGKLPGVTKSSW